MKKYVITLGVLAVVVLVAYEVLMLYDDYFPFGRMRETELIKPHEEPILLMSAGVVPFDGGEAVLRATPADALQAPLTLTDAEVIKAGHKGYFTYCHQCHGKYYDGNGTVGQSFEPLPSDLRSAKVQAASAGALFKEISYGIPGGRQPPLATTISIDERWQIVGFVKSLGVRK